MHKTSKFFAPRHRLIPMEILPVDIHTKLERLKQGILDLRCVAVAFSGGTDSSVLLRVAVECLGGHVVAVTSSSEVLPRRELEEACRLAEHLGVSHRVFPSHELEMPEFVQNESDRCYVCKRGRYAAILERLEDLGTYALLDGSNTDDLRDIRPGAQAARELGVRSPLQEAGLSKREIRLIGKAYGLQNWNKPASACLASRIPYGSPITRQKLEQVERAEEFLRELAIVRQLRVRHHGDTARIEVDDEGLDRLVEPSVRHRIVSFLNGLGFRYVTLDLGGYRLGSLNRSIKDGSQVG